MAFGATPTINIKQYNTGLNALTNVRFPVLSVSIPWLFPVTHRLLLRTQILLPLQFPYSLAVIKVSCVGRGEGRTTNYCTWTDLRSWMGYNLWLPTENSCVSEGKRTLRTQIPCSPSQAQIAFQTNASLSLWPKSTRGHTHLSPLWPSASTVPLPS